MDGDDTVPAGHVGFRSSMLATCVSKYLGHRPGTIKLKIIWGKNGSRTLKPQNVW